MRIRNKVDKNNNNNYSTIMAADEKEQCKPPCKVNTSQSVNPTPWLVQQPENQGGRAPLVFRLGGQLPPQPPWFLRQCDEIDIYDC